MTMMPLAGLPIIYQGRAIPYQSNHMAGLLTIHPASETTKRQNDIHG
jgi:hypothetical protein